MTLDDLNAHLSLVEQLISAKDILHSLEDRILSAQKYDGMPHAPGASRNTENLALLLEAQSEDVSRLERAVKNSEEKIRAWVNTIPDNRTKVIFNLHFLCGLKWEDVAIYAGGSNTFDSVRSTCYRYLNAAEPAE